MICSRLSILLGSQRIEHGVRAVDDPAVVARLIRDVIPLTVCPLSNIRLCVFPEMAKHTLADLLAAGAKVTINSDDPAYFGGYLNDNIRAVQAAFNFDAETWRTIARNSFEGNFAGEAQKAAGIAQLDVFFAVDG